MHGRDLGGHSVHARQVACATQRRRLSVLGPQTRPHLLQMVVQVAKHGCGDAVRHQVVRPRGRRPYYPACMVSGQRALADSGVCGHPCPVGIAYVPQHRGRSQHPHQAQAKAPRGEEPRAAESNTVANGDEKDGTAKELEESAGNDPAAMGTEPDAAPTPFPLQPSVLACERGAMSREHAGQLCTLAGLPVAVGGAGGGRGRQTDPSMSIPTWTPTTTAGVPKANQMAPSQSEAPRIPPGVDRPELPSSLGASVSCGSPRRPNGLPERGPEGTRKLEWYTRGRVALRWSWVVHVIKTYLSIYFLTLICWICVTSAPVSSIAQHCTEIRRPVVSHRSVLISC